MDSKEFVNYVLASINEKKKAYEDGILSGQFKTIEEYQKNAGIYFTLKSFMEGLPELHQQFMKKKEERDVIR